MSQTSAEPGIAGPDIADLALALDEGRLTSEEIVADTLARIDSRSNGLNAFVLVLRDEALAAARAADGELRRGHRRGPLHGLPIAVKDLLDVAGTPTSAGTALFADHRATRDSTVAERLRGGGAIIIGKLAMAEAALSAHHPTIPPPINPWNEARSAGFSSSGSGVAMAGGFCAASLGSDTGGSIRIPAALTGVTGIKPSRGRVSRDGVFPLVETLDVVGPLARSAADAAAVLGVIAGFDPRDPTTSTAPVPNYAATIGTPVSGLRIGVDWARFEASCDPVVVDVLRDAAAAMTRLGARIKPVMLPDYDILLIQPLLSASIAEAHRTYFPARRHEYGPYAAAVIESCTMESATSVAAAINAAAVFSGAFAAVYEDVDMILAPVVTTPAPEVSAIEVRPDGVAMLDWLRYSLMVNVTGRPAIALPGGFDANGVPVGFQLIGHVMGEADLIAAGDAFQRATEWHMCRPQV